jgi:carbonic anhydrase
MKRGTASLRDSARVLGAAWCLGTFLWCTTAGAQSHATGGAHAANTAHPAPTPNAALERLVEGNQRFVSGKAKHGHQSATYRHELTGGQHPFATILGCSDSRVPVELVFDQGFGDVFVIRVAGNVVGTDDLGSIEYAVHHLHTPLVVVMGHEGCGAVTSALMSADDRSHEAQAIQELLNQIEPALKDLDPALPPAERVHQGVEANVRQSVRQLQASADLMQPHEGAPPMIVGAVYEITTGKVRILK